MAQENKPPPSRPPLTTEQRTERIAEKLNKDLSLTDEQKPKVKEIILNREKVRDDINAKYPDKESKEYREASRKCIGESEKLLKAILTPEQLEKKKQ